MCSWLRSQSVGQFKRISGATVLRIILAVAALVVSKQRVATCIAWFSHASTHLLRIGIPNSPASAYPWANN